MRVFVTGATGFVGGRLIPTLVDAGHEVTALVRDADRYDAGADVRVLEGDLLEPEEFALVGDRTTTGRGSLADLLQALEIDAAYYLVHSMHAGADFAERDRHAARNFAEAVGTAGVDRVIYLGGLGEEGQDLSEHLQSRREVERVLAEGKADLTTLRAAIIIGQGSASFEMIRQLASRLPVMVTPKWVRNDCQPIYVGDVIAYLVGVLDAPATAGATFEIGGPDILTYEEILRRTREKLDGRLFVVPVPVLTPGLSSYWVSLMTDVETRVARPLIDGLRNPVVVTDDSIRDHVEVDLTPFDEAVARALGRTDRDQEVGDEDDTGTARGIEA